MRFAYADPPYLGCCKLYDHYHPNGRCWDDLETHALLLTQLRQNFPDGWAYSLSSPSLRDILPLTMSNVRVASWVKPFASFKPNVNPAYTWEPVIFMGGRKRARFEPTTKDHVIEEAALAESITLKKGLTGAKPRRFAYWIFDLLGAEISDELVDIFPGTGIVGDCWAEFCGRERPVQEGMLG